MHLYNIGYHTYEESDYIQLCHKEKFSKQEFDNIVAKATINILKSSDVTKGTTFQGILYKVADELIKNFDFKRVKFTSEFNVFGWADIFNENDWKHDRDEQLNSLTKRIK